MNIPAIENYQKLMIPLEKDEMIGCARSNEGLKCAVFNNDGIVTGHGFNNTYDLAGCDGTCTTISNKDTLEFSTSRGKDLLCDTGKESGLRYLTCTGE